MEEILFVHISSTKRHFSNCDNSAVFCDSGGGDDGGKANTNIIFSLTFTLLTSKIEIYPYTNVSTCELALSNRTFKQYYYHFLLTLSVSVAFFYLLLTLTK